MIIIFLSMIIFFRHVVVLYMYIYLFIERTVHFTCVCICCLSLFSFPSIKDQRKTKLSVFVPCSKRNEERNFTGITKNGLGFCLLVKRR